MRLSQEQLATWASLATVLERLPRALDAQLQESCGLTHFEYGVLFALDTAPERTLRLSTLAGYANCTLSRLSRAFTRLERAGLVSRETDATDGRFTLGILSDAGHDLVQSAMPGHHALIRELVFAPLTTAEADSLGALSRRIAEAIGPAEIWTPRP
ncbi:MarR family winged helix-turn-helix transcriptional regulator [Microbacterium sp. bgisy207]|jgi:DNA-binding MarR family transcriptional regulator|uniref:MarR family winged helix-turn-helix transcriptional regulator n=1 Tax=Microbacterium sp. bgisy207 TaxID=3413800 RepID=UPI003EBF5D4C